MKSYNGEILDDRYLVEEKIGRGGMGVVYRGKHIVIGRKIAIKFLNSEFSTHGDIVTRFYREAQTATQIGHRNIIEILDVGISKRNEPYLVMEYLEGENLAAMLKRTGPIDLAAACGILEPVLLALAAAHELGVVHRDLKPDNIFLVHDTSEETPSVKLIDFGVSKLMKSVGSEKLTQTGAALGTPSYMSPEQAAGADDVDHRSDLFSMGGILFEMLTGETPFTGTSNQQLMAKILTEPPRDPEAVNPSFPTEAKPIVMRALSRDPKDRYQSAGEMLDALKALKTFQDRFTQLTQCTSGIIERRCAMGDLGQAIGSDSDSSAPARILSDISRNATPGSWTGPKGNSASPLAVKGRGRTPILLVSIILLLAGIVVALYITRAPTPFAKKNPTPTASLSRVIETKPEKSFQREVKAAMSAPRPAPPKKVTLSLEGIPEGAIIRYGEIAIFSKQFEVPLSREVVVLSVDADGYHPFETKVTPDKDTVIHVEMRPRERLRNESAKAASEKPVDKKKRRSFLQGRRNTEIAEDFE